MNQEQEKVNGRTFRDYCFQAGLPEGLLSPKGREEMLAEWRSGAYPGPWGNPRT